MAPVIKWYLVDAAPHMGHGRDVQKACSEFLKNAAFGTC